MVRTKTTPRRITRSASKFLKRKKYIIKIRLENPKVVKFGGKQFTVRYKRVGKRGL